MMSNKYFETTQLSFQSKQPKYTDYKTDVLAYSINLVKGNGTKRDGLLCDEAFPQNNIFKI